MLLATFGQWAFVIGLALGGLLLLLFLIGSWHDVKRPEKGENQGSKSNGNRSDQGEES